MTTTKIVHRESLSPGDPRTVLQEILGRGQNGKGKQL